MGVVAASAGGLLRELYFEPAFDPLLNSSVEARSANAREHCCSGRLGKMRRIVETTFLDLRENRASLVVGIGNGCLVDLHDPGERLPESLTIEHEPDAQLTAVDLNAGG
ncbi:hypothetical protein FQZ97_1232880 [compost metagenome]